MVMNAMKIKAIITGTTGMVGQGVLYECMERPEVEEILIINRHPLGIKHPKVKEIILKDFFNLNEISSELSGYNVCYFCLGVSAFGMQEEDYTKITHDLTLNFAKICLIQNQNMQFIYVSGTGTDASEKSKVMWARIKGRTENNLLKMKFSNAYMFRPGAILPEKGIKSKTKLYQFFYVVLRPFYPLMRRMKSVTTTTKVGNAMINASIFGYKSKHLENLDINLLAEAHLK